MACGDMGVGNVSVEVVLEAVMADSERPRKVSEMVY